MTELFPFRNFKMVARFSIFTISILRVCCLNCAGPLLFLIHFQLPPVIKNMAFQKFSNMEQSLFTRFVRLGVPTVQLDAQGRARSRYIAYVLFGCLSNKCVTQQQRRSLATKTSPSNKCVTVEQIRHRTRLPQKEKITCLSSCAFPFWHTLWSSSNLKWWKENVTMPVSFHTAHSTLIPGKSVYNLLPKQIVSVAIGSQW